MSFPIFFDESKAGTMFRPDENTIIPEALAAGWAPSKRDGTGKGNPEKVALLLIDVQGDFVFPADAPFPGSLSVSGAVEDASRTAKFIYEYGDKITAIFASLDTHYMYQIFHRLWWKKEDGSFVEPFTMITSADIEAGKVRPVLDPIWSLEYVKRLEANGQKVLMIWPEHCLAISPGSSMVPIVSEAIIYHNAARRSQVNILWKGNEPKTESYGILAPEVPVPDSHVMSARGLNTAFLGILANYDRVYIAGQARTHCVLETIIQMVNEFKVNSSDTLKKMFILRDCMSDVASPPGLDFTAITDAKFTEFAQDGVNIINSTDGISFA